MHRCGTASPAETVALARLLVECGVRYRGLMGYEGHAVLLPPSRSWGSTWKRSRRRSARGAALYVPGSATLDGFQGRVALHALEIANGDSADDDGDAGEVLEEDAG